MLTAVSACASAKSSDATASDTTASSAPPEVTTAAPSADANELKRLCAELDSRQLDVRLSATDSLKRYTGLVNGGTEQQMEAAAAFCMKSGEPRPSWLPAR